MKIKPQFLFPLFLSIAVCLIFAHTLNYQWKHFDEQIIYNEAIYPIPKSFSQLIEIIKQFGLGTYFEASNPFYSSISNLRHDPLNDLILLAAFTLFQKNLFAYHLISLIFHVINTILFFLILSLVSLDFFKERKHSKITRLTFVSLLSLIWALHPVNVEAILLTTNWVAILSFSICFGIIYITIKFRNKLTRLKRILLFFCFLIPLFTVEQSFTIPIILFAYLFARTQMENKNLTFETILKHSIQKTMPLFFALGIFILMFIFYETKTNIYESLQSSALVTFQRIFWFSPQIFLHFLKLVFHPVHLSIDQTSMITISNKLFTFHSVFSVFLSFSVILIIAVCATKIKHKAFYFIFIAITPFVIALIPFLHIISPTYCLISERYLYFPLAMLIFGISHPIFYLISNLPKKKHVPVLITALFILCLAGTKTYIRTLDWKDSTTLFQSCLKESSNDLFKGLRKSFIGSILINYSKDQKGKEEGKNYLINGINTLENHLTKLKKDEEKIQDTIPEVLKFYGLDPKTLQAKTAYLLAYSKLGINLDIERAIYTLRPYMKDLNIFDTQIIDLYAGLLFSAGRLDEAEVLLIHAAEKKLSPTILTILSEIYIKKYGDYKQAEKYLRESFKYFPYDIQTLNNLKNLYKQTNNLEKYAYFSYLYGLRAHSPYSLNEAYNGFIQLNNEKLAKKARENINLITGM